MNNCTLRWIEELTENILYEYDIKIPIINIEELVEKLGGKIVYDNLEFDFVSICKFFLGLQEIHKDRDSLWLLIRNWQGS